MPFTNSKTKKIRFFYPREALAFSGAIRQHNITRNIYEHFLNAIKKKSEYEIQKLKEANEELQ